MLTLGSDTPGKRQEWTKTGLALVQVNNTLRQAFSRHRVTESIASSLCAYRLILMIHFYLLRAIVVNKANFSTMSPDFARRVRAAQVSIETALLRTGMPPALIAPAQTFFTELVGELCDPLNKLALQRSRHKEQREQAHGGPYAPPAAQKAQQGDPAFAQQLAADKAGNPAFSFSLSRAAFFLCCFYFPVFLVRRAEKAVSTMSVSVITTHYS